MRMVTAKEATEMLGVKKSTLYAWARDGVLRHVDTWDVRVYSLLDILALREGGKRGVADRKKAMLMPAAELPKIGMTT